MIVEGKKSRLTHIFLLLLDGISILFLASCSGQADKQASTGEEAGVFRPPPGVPQTPLVVPLPTATSTASFAGAQQSTRTPACVDDLRFIEDVTVPDGSLFTPGAYIDKLWRVENSGTCNWDDRYRLRLVEGSSLSAKEENALYPARSGTQAIIQLTFFAPAEPGSYRSAWQAFNPSGIPFGEVIFIQILVQ